MSAMSYSTPELTAQEVLRQAQDLLEEQLPLNAEGYKCTTDDLFKVLLGVAATKGTIEAVCADLVGTPDPHTIRGYFNNQPRPEAVVLRRPLRRGRSRQEAPWGGVTVRKAPLGPMRLVEL